MSGPWAWAIDRVGEIIDRRTRATLAIGHTHSGLIADIDSDHYFKETPAPA